MTIKNQLRIGVVALLLANRCGENMSVPAIKATGSVTLKVLNIAKEAYIYGFPRVDNCRVQYAYFVNKQDFDYKTNWNILCNISSVFISGASAPIFKTFIAWKKYLSFYFVLCC